MTPQERTIYAHRYGRETGLRYAAILSRRLGEAWRSIGDHEAAEAAEAISRHLIAEIDGEIIDRPVNTTPDNPPPQD